MRAEDKIDMLKNIPPLSELEKKRKIRTSIVLMVSTLISLLFLVFAFMQKKEADAQREVVRQIKMQAEEAQVEADKQRALAMTMEQEAMKQKLLAEQALADCQKARK